MTLNTIRTTIFLALAMFIPANATQSLKMATTTSTENSGLLDVLLPAFKKNAGIDVHVIAVGTGKALKYGENGDVDLVFVHARKAENAFVERGFGVNRRDVMYNDFVVLGPAGDPAGIKNAKSAAKALAKIADTKALFVSRGDESGTHKKETLLWSNSHVSPKGKWYILAGQGMGAVLTMANEKQAYTIADRGTFIAFEDKIDLVVLCEGDHALFNPYGVIVVNPEKHKHVQYDEAMIFIEWITSPKGQELIAGFTMKGTQLFHPNATQAVSTR